MPSIFIEKVNTKYKVRVRGLKNDPFKGQKTRTFPSRAQAEAFIKKLQKQFKSGDFSFFCGTKSYLTIGEVIELIIKHPQDTPKSTISLLKRISEETSISSVPAEKVNGSHWYNLAVYMRENWKNQPQTIAHNLSTLKTQLQDAKTILRCNVDLSSYPDALSTLKRKGYVTQSKERTRRPTQLELNTITARLRLESSNKRRKIPLLDIFEFAIETAARVGEICSKRISWQNYDEDAGTLTITKRKSPKKGREVRSCFELSPKAIEIIERQPRGKDTDPIFPYNKNSFGSAWRTIMKELNIQDLRFHDLRAEALCRLYDKGWDLSAISKVSGHRDLNILNNIYLRFYPSYTSRLVA
ncbi:site-specific integrase [Vibrio vulnificus]|uniref:site-specific integrase n=1 Tax=Vibrio vulnificus TaxID=672 RepID=UPI003EDB5EDC